MAAIVAVAWQRYLNQLHAKPLQTKALTSSALAACSDVLAQRLTSSAPINWRRTLTLALYGLLWGGPANHFWQQMLERIFPPNKNDGMRSVKKVALDQLTFGPINNLAMMIFMSLVVEGRSLRYVRAKIAADYPGVQARGWRLWPVAQWINHEFVPLNLRVLWSNMVSLGWTTFLILRARGAPAGSAGLVGRRGSGATGAPLRLPVYTKAHRV